MEEYTIDSLIDLLKQGKKISDKIQYSGKKTDGKVIRMSIGRVIVNVFLPEDFELVDYVLDKKTQSKLYDKLLSKYGSEKTGTIISDLQKLMFDMSSIIPSSFNISGLSFPQEIIDQKNEFRKIAKKLSPKEYDIETTKIAKNILKYTQEQNLGINDMLISGAKGNPVDDWKTLTVSKGFTIDIEGQIKGPIVNGISDGYGKKDYYNAAAEARRDFYYKSTMSADPGYLARKIVMANSGVVIDDSEKDCGSKKYYELYVNKNNANLILTRTYNNNGKLTKITTDNIDELINKQIKLRSPLYCKAEKGICPTCYGDLYKKLNTKSIGILAGGAVNKVALNAMMKMKHKSSQVNVIDVNFIDIIKKSRLDLKELNKYFEIFEKEIKAKTDVHINIDRSDYKDTEWMDCGDYYLTPGIFDIEIGIPPYTKFITLPFAFQVQLFKPTDQEIDGKMVLMGYKPGETIIKMDMYIDEVNPGLLSRLFDGGAKFIKDPETLTEILSSKLSGIDLCQIECIVANMFRRTDDESEPCRIRGDYKNSTIYGQKKLPFITSWLTSLSFENVNKAIEYGLLSGKDANYDPFEKIVLEKFGDHE